MKGIIAPYRGLPVPVYVLFVSRIINRMGDFVSIFLTLYLSRYLGFSEKQTGLILSLVGLSMMSGALLGGKLTDLAGRKKIMLGLQAMAAASVLICGFIPDSPALPGLLILFTFFNGAVRPVNTALLTDLTTQKNRAAAFSLLYLGINIGISAGPILAGFLFNNYRRWIFWGDGLTTLLTILLILILIPEPEECSGKTEAGEHVEEGSSLKALLGRPILAIYTILSIFSALIYAQTTFTLPLQMLHVFDEKGPRLFGLIMSFNAVVVLIVTPLQNYYMKDIRPLRRIALGQVLYSLGFGLLIVPVHTLSWFFFSTFIWTCGEVLDATNSGVFVANHSPRNHRGRFNSFFLISKGAGRSLAPLISGLVLESLGISYIWGLCLFLGFFLFMAMNSLDKKDQRMLVEI
ncbi:MULTISPECIES: MFS transporter [unclassified Oceanispirochaeta]|uniref:MFS transporter n=1 Tax=unclassified Oceanispirochaeta TaxID=2635722 RepID=UPI000E08EEEC|nr:MULTISPECIES: MFS transporter [unclassified Oceanispirochaeta]MBF9014980.1 MFS transporter [Oceanispirochaeta sp. M2]NPD71339.1 MFS transporter [Oceanispirochaeta sp. M1]RDG33305.1 MFS transporter [Oceanispirochaeta sp. M1]